MLKLVSELATHPIQLVPGAGMFKPRMTTVRAVAQLAELAGVRTSHATTFEEAAHGVEDAS